MRDEIRKIQELMEAADYVTDAPIATSVYLAMRLQKPLLIEGPAGVGKTEVAKVMARMLGTNLIRLQCYEGLDASTVLRVLVGGRFLEVTPEHRFLRTSDTGNEIVRASDLRVGDRIPLHKALHLRKIEEPRFEFLDSIVKLAPAGRELLHSAYKT